MKRILSFLLVLAMLVTVLPPVSVRAEAGQTPPASSLQFSGDGSFGKLLNNSLAEEETGDEELECLITSLEFRGKTASVSLTAPRDAKLVVAVYDENDDTMLGSGTVDVAAGEVQLQVEIQIDTMPEYFRGKAFLLDRDTNAPLSQVRCYELATKGYRDIAEAKATDFPEDRVIRLDNNINTNFVVMRADTFTVDSSRVTDNGDGTYTLSNATAEEKAMQPGNVFLSVFEDGTMLVVKAASVSVQGDSVMIRENPSVEAMDAFDMIKLDIDSTQYGLEAMDPADAGAAGAMSRGGDPFNTQSWKVADSKLELKFAEGLPEISVPITITTQYYESRNYAYYSAQIQYSFEFKMDLRSFEKDLVDLEWEPRISVPTTVFGLKLEGIGEFKIEVEAGCEYNFKVQGSFGKEYYGRNGRFYDISTSPKIVNELKVGGEFSVSFAMGVGVSFLRLANTDICIAELSVKGKTELTIEASVSVNDDFSEKIHVCALCGNLEISMGLSVEGELSLLLILEWTPEIPIRKKKIAEAHFCAMHDIEELYPYDPVGIEIIHGEWKECSRYAYKVTMEAQDSQKNPLAGATVTLVRSDAKHLKVYKTVGHDFTYMPLEELVTDSSGKLTCYLENGSYIATVGGSQIPFTVSGGTRSVLLTGNEMPPPEPVETTLVIRTDTRLLQGTTTPLTAVLISDSGEEDVTQQVQWSLEDGSVAEITGLSLRGLVKGSTKLHAFFTDAGETYTDEVEIQVLEVIDRGTTTDLSWILTSDYVLTVTGEGSTYSRPWSAYNPRIKGVIVKEGITGLAANAFEECVSLETVSLPESLQSISSRCFAECSALTYLYIPKNVSSLLGSALVGCTSLRTVEIAEDNPYFRMVDGMILSADRKKLVSVPCLPEGGVLRVPETVLKIENDSCTELAITGLELPDTLREVGQRAFQYCTSLESITVYTPSIDPGTLVVNNQVNSNAFQGCTALKNFQIPSAIKSIGFETFAECTGLESITIPDHVTILSYATFRNCTALTSVELPEGLEDLGSHVFDGCTSLESVEVPDSVTYLAANVFSNCTSLVSAKLPKRLETTGTHIFYNCPALTHVELPENLTFINANMFQGCTSLTEIDIPETVTIIYSWAFNSCSNLSDVVLPAGLKRIESYAFDSCYALTELELPEGLEFIGFGALAGAGLVSVVIPDSVTELDMTVFGNCKNLNDVTVGAGINKLAGITFAESTVREIYFRGILTEKLDWSDFNDCEYLTDIYYVGSESQWPGVTVLDPYNPPLEGVNLHFNHPFDNLPNPLSAAAASFDGTYEVNLLSSTKATDAVSVRYAGLVPGMEYVLLMLRGGDAPLTAENLLYIDQQTAPRNGVLSFRFVPRATAADARVVLISAQGQTQEPQNLSNPFTDVAEGMYYYDSVLWAVENGITTGTSATTFSPDDFCTRGQVVTFLWRTAGSPEPESTHNPFADVAEGMYYYKAVLWAVENGITTGTSATTFAPDSSCTRGHVVTFLHRFNRCPAANSSHNPFTDVAEGMYYHGAVLWAVEKGITNGMSATTFEPDSTCTRGQVVTFLYRAVAKEKSAVLL